MADAGATGPIIDITPQEAHVTEDVRTQPYSPPSGVPWFLYAMIVVALFFVFGDE
jgi:hypothetical protein